MFLLLLFLNVIIMKIWKVMNKILNPTKNTPLYQNRRKKKKHENRSTHSPANQPSMLRLGWLATPMNVFLALRATAFVFRSNRRPKQQEQQHDKQNGNILPSQMKIISIFCLLHFLEYIFFLAIKKNIGKQFFYWLSCRVVVWLT